MKWDELTEKHANEYKAYLNGFKKSLEGLNASKQELLKTANCKEADLPDNLKNMLQRDADNWRNEWGMYGTAFKAMRISQQKEIEQYCAKEGLVAQIRRDNSKDKDQDRDGGR